MDHMETSRRRLARQIWSLEAQIMKWSSFLRSPLPPFTVIMQTYPEKLASFEIHGGKKSSPQPPSTAHTETTHL